MTPPLLSVRGLTKHYPVTRGAFGRVVGQVQAADDVSFDVAAGETLGLVGESGCGKSTVGRCVLRLIEPTAGQILFAGKDVAAARGAELQALRRRMQIVFQDPVSSLNPRLRVVDLLGESLVVHGLLGGRSVDARVSELLVRVGLPASALYRYPHEFSGGQRQRLGIARAVALSPELVVCDEAVSALDVSVQAQVLNLLGDLQRELGLSYLFIAHDLSVVRHVSHRVAVMYLGRIVELAPANTLYAAPAHPYTRALLAAVPLPDPRRRRRHLPLQGEVPSPLDPPRGCRFHPRCPAAVDRCREEAPPVVELGDGHRVACVHAEGLDGGAAATSELDRRVAAAARASTALPASHAVRLPALPPPVTPDRTPPPKLPVPPAALVAGIALLILALGHPLSGGLAYAAAGAAFIAVSRGRRRSVTLGLCLALVPALWLGRASRERSRLAQARSDLAALAAEVNAQARVRGTAPVSLAELGFRIPAALGGRAARDPWGQDYELRAAPGAPGAVDVASAGPDGWPSQDDLVSPALRPASLAEPK